MVPIIVLSVGDKVNKESNNYKEMEKLLGVKLKGNETWSELKALQKKKFYFCSPRANNWQGTKVF